MLSEWLCELGYFNWERFGEHLGIRTEFIQAIAKNKAEVCFEETKDWLINKESMSG